MVSFLVVLGALTDLDIKEPFHVLFPQDFVDVFTSVLMSSHTLDLDTTICVVDMLVSASKKQIKF